MKTSNRRRYRPACAGTSRLVRCAAALVIAGMAIVAHAQDALTLVANGAPRSAQVQAAQRLARHLLAVSRGAMAVRIEKRAGTLVGLWQGVREGSIDLHVADAGALVVLPEARLFNVLWTPFLFRDQDHYRQFVRSAEFGALARTVRETTGIRFVGQIGDKAPRVITNRLNPVRTVADMAGLRFPVARNPIFVRTFELWGAVPEPMTSLQFHMALAGATVDGQDNGVTDFIGARVLVETHKHFSPVNWLHSGVALWIGERAWQRLNAREREWLAQAAHEAAAEGELVFAEEMATALARLPALGIQVTEPDLDSFRFVKARIVADMEGHAWPEGLVARIDAVR
ncbi:MAG: TRAP transporter substrate-binding protein [Burkholderiaceae bacterium]